MITPTNENVDINPSQQDMRELQYLYNSNEFYILENKARGLLKKYNKSVELQNILGFALSSQRKLIDATKIFEKIIKTQPDFYFAYNNMGNVLKDLCKLDEAKIYYQKCIKINPNYIEAYIGLGKIFLDLNKLDKSAAVFKQALKLKPENGELHRRLSQVVKYEQTSSHVKDMEKIISSGDVTHIQQMHLSFALGKAYEDMKSYDKAFLHWKKGNFLKRKQIKYSTKYQARLVKTIKENFTNDLFEKFKNYGNRDNTLIFIVGMPRSGTTLVQQIISSHPKVFGVGESNQFSNKINECFFKENGFLKENLYNFDPINFSKIGEEYIKNIRQLSTDTKHILVKDLLNFTWLGFIKLIFPNAKIVHCVRNPMDTCVSLFKNYFVGGVDFSYDLIEMGEYYNLYRDIMLFWNNILPNYYVNIFYEELINDPKKQIEKLLNVCNLEWNESCMQFYNNKHFMSTGSNSINIHQPIYKTSMQYWKRYEKQLQPLLEILKT
tara:strand:+ start:1937 stop:3418 length:1482 start_codon:yes stop_codon:yes gene_type:complete